MNDTPATFRWERMRRRYFIAAAGLFLVIVFVGFAPSFFLKFVFEHPGIVVQEAERISAGQGSPRTAAQGLPIHVVAHGLFATIWMVLFLSQAYLIGSGRRATHRKLGVVALVVAAGVSVSGVFALFRFLPRMIALADPADPFALIAEQLPSASGDLGSFMVFTIAVVAAALLRHRPEPHKQLMLLASMTLLSPPIARIWMSSGLDNAMELWFPITENLLALAVIGGYWLVRRRRPWVLLGGFVSWIVIYSAMIGLGTIQAVQDWALGWMI